MAGRSLLPCKPLITDENHKTICRKVAKVGASLDKVINSTVTGNDM